MLFFALHEYNGKLFFRGVKRRHSAAQLFLCCEHRILLHVSRGDRPFLIGGVCGYNTRDRERETKIVRLLSCTKNIASHESAFKFTGPEDEIDLILCRAHICRPLCSLRF